MDLTPISGLPDGRLMTALEADTSARSPELSETERAELRRLRGERATIRRVLSDTVSVLQLAADCMPDEQLAVRKRCRTQRDRVWAGLALIEREARL